MTDHLRYARASLLAPAPFVVLMVAICLVGFLTSNGNSELDDAPVRTAGVFVMLSPLLYLLLALTLYVLGRGMSAARVLSRRALILLALAASVVAGVLAALSSPFGGRDAAISAAIFAALTLTTSVPLALLWWRIAHNYSWSGRELTLI
jgi:hypothetical protein